MCRVLDAINNNIAVGCDSPNGFRNRSYIDPHASHRRSLQNGGNAGISGDQSGIIGSVHAAGFYIMGHIDIGSAGNLGPMLCGAARCGMFQRTAQHRAAFRGGHDCISNQSE